MRQPSQGLLTSNVAPDAITVLPDFEHAAALYRQDEQVDTVYASLEYWRAFRPNSEGVLHLVSQESHTRKVLLSYSLRGPTLSVVNRLMPLSGTLLEACARQLFVQHPSVRCIQLSGVYAQTLPGPQASIPHRVWANGEDFVVELPESFAEYLNVFGSKTRKNLRYCASRLKREHPQTQFQLLMGADVPRSLVSRIAHLNRLRMQGKGTKSGVDADYEDRLFALLTQCGAAGVIRDADRVLAGTLCARAGNGWSLQMIAHDPEFDSLRPGLLCLLNTIECAIRGGAKRFHLLWGKSDYKVLFGARDLTLHEVRFYRTDLDGIVAVHDRSQQLRQRLRGRVANGVGGQLLRWSKRISRKRG